MSVQQNVALIELLTAHPLLTEAEARKELGLPAPPPDREDELPTVRAPNDKYPKPKPVGAKTY